MNKKIRIFTCHTHDIAFMRFYSTECGYLLSLLVDKCGKSLTDFKLTTIYPYDLVFQSILNTLEFFDEKIFIFYLENYFHSNEYFLNFIKLIVQKLRSLGINDKTIIIQSYKLSQEKSLELLEEFEGFKIIVIRGDMEYFFNELIHKNTKIENIKNILYLNNKKININSGEEILIDDINEYIHGAYYNGYLELIQDDITSKSWMLNKDNVNNYYNSLKTKQILICSGRGCLYKCTYCFRGVKFSKVRQIDLETIKKDLDYIQSRSYKSVYFYDDCFLTTNSNRLTEILSLINSYNFSYYVAIRYEMALKEGFLEQIIDSKINRIQIGVQSIDENTNKLIMRKFEIERFKNLFSLFKKKGKNICLDLILGLPGETIKQFIKTFNFAVSLEPESIFINTLFLNPGTNLYKNKDKYGIKFDYYKNNPNAYLFSVPVIHSSESFPEKDIEIAIKYMENISRNNKKTYICIR